MYNAKQANKKDKEEIFRFFKKIYPLGFDTKIAQQFDWQMSINPFAEEHPSVWIVKDKSEIIGSSGSVLEKWKAYDHEVVQGYGVDLFVNANFRGKGLAGKMVYQCILDSGGYFNISMAPATFKTMIKCGGKELPALPTFIFPLKARGKRVHILLRHICFGMGHYGRYFNHILKIKWIDHFLYYTGLYQLSGIILSKSQKQYQEYQSERTNILNANEINLNDIDSLWMQCKNNFDYCAYRNKAYFKWKFIDQPQKKHYTITIYKEDQLQGYMVIRCGTGLEPNFGVIVDFLIIDNDNKIFKALLIRALEFFKEEKADLIYCTTNIKAFIAILKKIGFLKSRVHYPLINMHNQEILTEIIKPSSKCYFTNSDAELDRYPLKLK